MMRLATPRVHLNGTSRQELLLLNLDALDAIGSAITALHKAAPHPRDYYPIDDDAFGEARSEHEMRLQMLTDVYDEIRRIAEAINKQGPTAIMPAQPIGRAVSVR